ncbi:GMC oxidoreductase-domain-containing protein [Aspergillus granulosus]|uniref:GMC oxidoreductase-domain-containing protein n=1 Tax=Aspergillus granulosus TaxID=176169 RepID=A0ABR4HEI5_9EURO
MIKHSPPCTRNSTRSSSKSYRTPNEPTGQYTLDPFQCTLVLVPTHEISSAKKTPGNFITVLSTLSYPLSRGPGHIASRNPWAPLIIDHGILREPADLDLLARHSMWADKLTETPAMTPVLKKDGARLHSDKVPGVRKAQSLCKKLTLSMGDVSGACAMMPREDGGVVGSMLKVYEMANVRVADASIFPLVPRGNIEATVYAVAERAAAIIKEEYKLLSG